MLELFNNWYSPTKEQTQQIASTHHSVNQAKSESVGTIHQSERDLVSRNGGCV